MYYDRSDRGVRRPCCCMTGYLLVTISRDEPLGDARYTCWASAFGGRFMTNNDTEHRRRSRWRCCGCIALVVLLLAAYFAYWMWSRAFGVRSNPDLKSISELTSLEFPPSSRLEESQSLAWQGWELRAKVELDRADVHTFLDAFPSPHKESSRDRLGVTNDMAGSMMSVRDRRMRWWDPDSASTFTAATAKLDDGDTTKELRVLVALDDPKYAVIYVQCDGY